MTPMDDMQCGARKRRRRDDADVRCTVLRQGLPASAVMAVGDGSNDLAMLSGVTAAGGLGVAMANAVPAVRRMLWPKPPTNPLGLPAGMAGVRQRPGRLAAHPSSEPPKLPCDAHGVFLCVKPHATQRFPGVVQINY